MASDYKRIAENNVTKYGTDVGRYGRTLLARPYAERTHFIYELLHNAEDALARRAAYEGQDTFSKSVAFRLASDRLTFRHFGKPFDRKYREDEKSDVEAICGLVEGTGAGDPSRIGRFGIGFKSVYAYTLHPEIHSGSEHFRIEDYVLPRTAQPVPTDTFETVFVFPFDHDDVSPHVAFAELEEYFRGCTDDVWFVQGEFTDEDKSLLKALGCEDRPRGQRFMPELDATRLRALRRGYGCREEYERSDYRLHGLESVFQRLQSLDRPQAVELGHILWQYLLSYVPPPSYPGSTPSFFQGVYRWTPHTQERSTSFDADFLERLRAVRWLPGQDGKMNKPSDLSPDDLPDGFTRNEALEHKALLNMRPRKIDALARETGLDADVLNYLRNHPNEQDQFKRRLASERAKDKVLAEQPQETSTERPQSADIGEATERASSDRQRTRIDSGVRVRLETHVYVEPVPSSQADEHETRPAEKRSTLGQAGIQKVLQYEANASRNAEYKGQTHPGYDIESTDASGMVRFIEVKAITGDWDQRGVGLSATQFRKAQELGEQFWLYVVERAEQSDSVIHPIQNPACLVSQFFYDSGWKALADVKPNQLPPPVASP